MSALYGLLLAVLLILLTSRAFWSLLNAGGAQTGRGIAWFASGGLGRHLARIQIERERQGEAMARLLLDAAGWRHERARGLARYAASPHRGGLPGEVWQPGYGWRSRRLPR